MHWDRCMSNANVKQFFTHFADISKDDRVLLCITMNFENGTYRTNTVGVCNKKYQIGGDYRNCNFADINSHGLDIGLIQVNSYFQTANGNIQSLGGPDCIPTIARGRDRSDPCNQRLIEWLSDVNNNAKVAKKVYHTQGLTAWSAFNKHVKPYL